VACTTLSPALLVPMSGTFSPIVTVKPLSLVRSRNVGSTRGVTCDCALFLVHPGQKADVVSIDTLTGDSFVTAIGPHPTCSRSSWSRWLLALRLATQVI
jgi:hypothetical protein